VSRDRRPSSERRATDVGQGGDDISGLGCHPALMEAEVPIPQDLLGLWREATRGPWTK
jgi:hypothetical protein